MRGKPLLPLTVSLMLAGCTAARNAADSAAAPSPLSACASDTSRMIVRRTGQAEARNMVSGKVSTVGTDRPQILLRVELVGDTTLVASTDEGGNFRFDALPPGQYRVVVRSFAYNPLERVIDVPTRGALELDIELALAPDQQGQACLYEQRMAEPALTAVQRDSMVVQRSLGAGVEIRQTIFLMPVNDELRVQVRLVNIGRIPATISRRCEPWVTSPVLVYRHLGGASVMCAPRSETLAVGDSIVFSATGPLRGSPGRHRTEIRPVDPAALHLSIELEFVALHREDALARISEKKAGNRR